MFGSLDPLSFDQSVIKARAGGAGRYLRLRRPDTHPDPMATTSQGVPLTCLFLVPMQLWAKELAWACSKICIESKLESQSKENNQNLEGSSGGQFRLSSDRRTVRNMERAC